MIPLLVSRFSLICCGILLFILTTIGLCGGNSVACFSVMAADGLATLGWVAGATALGAVILHRFNLQSSRALFIATAGGLGLGVFSLLGLALGLLGWLNRTVAISFPVASLLVFTADLLLRHRRSLGWDRSTIEQWLRAPAKSSWLWLIPVVSLAIAAVSASLMPGLLWKPLDPHPYDVTSYHLLVPREWFEGGRIVPLAHNVFSYFPFNAEMQFLLLMHAAGGPWVAMYACQFVCLGYGVLMVLAVMGACGQGERPASNVQRPTSKSERSQNREVNSDSLQCWTLDVGRWTFSPILAAAAVSTVPWLIMLCGVAYVESALMLYTALAIAWALHGVSNPAQLIRAAILSGIAAGFACGVKITAVPMLLLAVPVALAVVLLVRRPVELTTRRIFIACVSLGIAGSLVLSPWLIRNFIWCGNPLFPVAMKALGHDHFSAEQMVRFAVAHSPTADQQTFFSRLVVLWTGVIAHWQFGFLILPAGLTACAVTVRHRQTWVLVICGAFVLVVWIGFTHLLPRFLVMLIPIAAIAVGRIDWSRAWRAAVVMLLLAAGIGWSFVIPQLYRQSNPPPFANGPRPALFGMGSSDALTALLMPTGWIDIHDESTHVALIGDCQAFLYQLPMSQLHYRSVFNVDGSTDDPIDAWIGPQVRGDAHWYLVINPVEIERLHRTYRNMPALPREWEPQLAEGRTFFLRGDQLPKK